MSGTNLQYSIVNKSIYKPKDGKVDSIYQKNKGGFLVLIGQKFQMTLKLKSPAIILSAEIKNWNSDAIRFIFINKDEPVGEFYQILDSQNKTMLISFDQNRQKDIIVNKVIIQLDNLNGMDQKLIGLKYLLLNGQKIQNVLLHQGKIIKKNTNYYQSQYIPKQKVEKNKKQNLKQFDRVTKRQRKKQDQIMDVEDQQMKQAIMLSLHLEDSHRQVGRKAKKTSKIQEKSKKSERRFEQVYEQDIDPQYTKINYESCKDVFANVNLKWLENQRKIQIEKKVKESERLSNYIKIKHLMGKRIIVDSNSQQRRQQLQAIASQLGAKIIKQVGDDCILVTQRKDSQMIDKAKKYKRIKVVKSSYLQQCKQKNKQLDVRNYTIKL